MHELGIVEEIVRAAGREAERKGASRVVSVGVRVGALLRLDVDNLLFLLAVARADSPYTAGTVFRATEEPALLRCRSCGELWKAENSLRLCDRCGASEVEALTGEGIALTDVELEVDGEGPAGEPAPARSAPSRAASR